MAGHDDVERIAVLRIAILEYAQEHGFVINPGKGMEAALQGFVSCGFCPAAQSRTECPCPECADEVAATGRCAAHLFWRSNDDYATTIRSFLKERADQKRKKETEKLDDELVAALVGLGYKTKEAKKKAGEVPAHLTELEDKVLWALKDSSQG